MKPNFSSPSGLLFLAIIPFILYIRSMLRWKARSRGCPVPPGPTPLPIVGNMFNTPKYKTWVAFRKLSALYGMSVCPACEVYENRSIFVFVLSPGNIIHFRILGQSIMVLGSPDVITEFLEKHSANTSNRVQTPLIDLYA